MKHILKMVFLAAATVTLCLSCSKEGEYNLTETAPLDFKTYYDGLNVTFASQTQEATNISWNFGDNTPEVTGDSVVHTYTSIGNYVISMKGDVSGTSYEFHTILRVDKPALVSMTDDSFDDWDNVTYPDFILSGKGAITAAKVDYDANYLYIYVEFDANVENAGLEDHIFGVYMDADNSVATGFSMKEMGVDYGIEGSLYGEWWDQSYTDMVNGDPGWPFTWFPAENVLLPGLITQEGDKIRMEFGLSREVFKMTSDAVSFSMSIMNSDWSDVGNIVTPLPDYSEKVTVRMNKSNK